MPPHRSDVHLKSSTEHFLRELKMHKDNKNIANGDAREIVYVSYLNQMTSDR